MPGSHNTISLVLGSGGARGLAHVGVIHWLEENGYEIKSIAGSSMGALVGGIHAAGKLKEYEQWVRAIKKMDILNLLDISWDTSGLVKGDKIINTLVKLVGDQRIEDLPITFTAVAVDIKREREVWLQEGRLFDAIRASMSLPLFFTPFRYKHVDLVDGGVLNPVPIAPTFSDRTDLTIAVNLSGPPEEKPSKLQPQAKKESYSDQIQESIERFIRQLKGDEASSGEQDWDVYDIASRSFDAMQSTIARQKLAAYPPDHVIHIPRNACTILEFDRAAEMIDLGYDKAREYMTQRLV